MHTRTNSSRQPRRHRLVPCVVAVLSMCWLGRLQAQAPVVETANVEWQTYTGSAIDGRPLVGELGRIRVPERHGVPDGPALELAFVRYRTSHPQPGPPIFFLAGGPGGSGVEFCALTATHPQLRLLEHCDVIGVDQRGTGRSVPNLMIDTGTTVRLPLDRQVERAEEIVALIGAIDHCVDDWRGQGVDLAAFNSVESADDIDAVRRALGYDQIMLFGTSYGAHLAIAYLRRHAAHVSRAIMTKVEGPNHTWKLPSTVQRHLRRLHERVAIDPVTSQHVPDLIGLIRKLLHQLQTAPVTVALRDGDETVEVTLGPHDLRVEISRALSETPTIAKLPAQLHRYATGDWTQLAERVREYRRIAPRAMTFMMDCASGATAERLARIQGESRDEAYLLGDAINAPFAPEMCEACGNPDLGDEFRGPLRCDVPVLFVSGTLDVRTPPENVEEIRDGFLRHAHIVVENVGHDSRELMSRQYRDLVQAFIRGEPIESCTITLPFIFEPIEGE